MAKLKLRLKKPKRSNFKKAKPGKGLHGTDAPWSGAKAPWRGGFR